MEDAKTNLTRMEALFQSGDISAQSFEQIQSNVKMAQLQYDAAKLAYDTQVEYSTITAPISGLVESFNIEAHDMISQQTVICVISGEGSKAVSFSVTEQVVENLAPGDVIRIEKNGSEYEGTITEVSSMIDAATGLFKVKASVDQADALATGSMVKLYVTSDIAKDVMTLPVDAIYHDGGDSYVYTYDNGTVHKVFVESGIYDSERIQILSGVTREDQIITTWTPELYEGAVVQLAQ
ncbi:MAG: efflux RND transporter periplasmic adaptor subunit [Lachnospiraceae bacterium]